MKPRPLFLPSDRRQTVKLRELAELTGIPQTTIREYVARGEIPGAMRAGPRSRWRFDRQSLEAWWPTYQKTELIRPLEIKPPVKTNRKNGKKRN